MRLEMANNTDDESKKILLYDDANGWLTSLLGEQNYRPTLNGDEPSVYKYAEKNHFMFQAWEVCACGVARYASP